MKNGKKLHQKHTHKYIYIYLYIGRIVIVSSNFRQLFFSSIQLIFKKLNKLVLKTNLVSSLTVDHPIHNQTK